MRKRQKRELKQKKKGSINQRSINFWHFVFDDGESLRARARATDDTTTQAERGLGEHRVIIKPGQSSGACKTRGKVNARGYTRKTGNVFASSWKDPKDLAGWVVQGGDDKKQPLRRDGITTVRRTNRRR